MAVTTAPLLSFGASGAIAKTQVYSTWKGRAYARRYVIPANPNTTAQQSTRNVFRWLNDTWRYMPSNAVAAWNMYANSLRITNRNAFVHANLSTLRPGTDLTGFVFSPAAGGGIPATAMSVTPGAGQLTVALTAPVLPAGWAITQAIAAAIADQDPHSGTLFTITSDVDASSPYSIVLTGLTAAQLYQVGGWFQFTKDDGSVAYGVALLATGTPT